MKKWLLPIFLGVFFFTVSVSAQINLGEQINTQLGGATTRAEVGQPLDPRMVVATVIQIFLSILGSVFLVLVIMSGYWLITARGNEEKVEKATKTIRGAIIGLIVVLMAYAITSFLTSRLVQTTLQGGSAANPRCADALDPNC